MRKDIRELLNVKNGLVPPPPKIEAKPDKPRLEQFYSADELAKAFSVNPKTIRRWFEDEKEGVLRYGNSKTYPGLRRHVMERYSEFAVKRLIDRLSK